MFDFDVRSGGTPFEPELLEDLAPLGAAGSEFSEPIANIPRRAPLVVAPSWTLREAFRMMAERHLGAALVASHGVLLGMLSEREIVRRLLEPQAGAGEMPVWQAMVSEPETLLESDTIAYAIKKLWTLGGRAMPIVRPSGAVFGVLDTQDVVAWMCGRVGAAPSPRTGHV
jgi:CBS domain-containing protein